jgi:hypothetical protein
MAARGNYCFWLVDFYISSSLKLFSQMNWNLEKSTNQKQELPVAATFVNGLELKWAIFIEDLPTKFRPSGLRFFRNQPIRNKNGLWRPGLLTDKYEMSNLYRGPSIDASYQVSVHFVCHPFTFHILIFSENPRPNELKHCRKVSKECTFCCDPLPNIAATGNSCFWLANF